MKRALVVVFGLLLAFGSGIVGAQFAPVQIRHELSPSFEIFQDGHAIDGKVIYMRDRRDVRTCTQIILYGDKTLPVPASPQTCTDVFGF